MEKSQHPGLSGQPRKVKLVPMSHHTKEQWFFWWTEEIGYLGPRITTPIVMVGCKTMAVLVGLETDFQICYWLLELPDSHCLRARHLLGTTQLSWVSTRQPPCAIVNLGKWALAVLSQLCYNTLMCYVVPVSFSWTPPDHGPLKGSDGALHSWLGSAQKVHDELKSSNIPVRPRQWSDHPLAPESELYSCPNMSGRRTYRFWSPFICF